MSDKVISLETGKVFQVKKDHKYLIIFPAHAKLQEVGIALEKFFDPAPVFILGAQDINAIKITEILEEHKKKKGGKKNAK